MGELTTREKPFVRDNPQQIPGRIPRESIKGRSGIAPMGRPTTYSEQLVETVCDNIRNGASPRAAALAAGINHATYHEWLLTVPMFADRLQQAEAESLVAVGKAIYQAGTAGDQDGDWKAAIEFAKRRDRATWGDTIDIRKVDTEQLMDMIRQQQDDEPPRVILDTVEDVI